MATGYGQDTWCIDGVQTGRLARGRQVVAQALYHRLITPRGQLRGGPEEEIFGLDVSGFVGSLGAESACASLPGQIEAELLKDDRVADVRCTFARTQDGAGLVTIVFEIAVALSDEGEDFVLTVAASSVGVALIGGMPTP
jgi:hypothetical protein